MSTWKRASEITEPGAYWVDDRRPTGTPSASRDWYVLQVHLSNGRMLYAIGASMSWHGQQLKHWDKNIYLYGPIEPPEVEGKK